MTQQGNEGETLLMRVISGELDPDSDEFRSAARLDPRMTERLAELRSVQHELGEMARTGEELVAAARGAATSADASLVRRVLGPKLLLPRAAPRTPPRRAARYWLVAAALLLALASALYFRAGPDPEPNGTLDQPTRGALVARPSLDGLTLELGAPPRGGWYLVRVLDDDAADGAILHEIQVEAERWNLPTELVASWRAGRNLRVVVQAYADISQTDGLPRSLVLSPP